MFVRTKKRDDKTYLMIVENKRDGARTVQTVLHSLGRLDQLLENGELDALLTSLSRFSEKLSVLGAAQQGDALTAITRRIGPALIFERLWRELGVGDVIRELSQERKFGNRHLHAACPPGRSESTHRRRHPSLFCVIS